MDLEVENWSCATYKNRIFVSRCFGFCPCFSGTQSRLTPRDGVRIRASPLLIIPFPRAASQVLPFLTWLAAVRRGVGLGVVGVSVAERKPPLEVDPASCAYPLSLFLPRPSLDDLSVPVLSVVQSHVLSLQLSRAAFRPLAPHAHSEFRFPSTERGSLLSIYCKATATSGLSAFRGSRVHECMC